MTKQYEKGILVMNYLQGLGMNMSTVGTAIDDSNLEKSYRIIIDNPQITKGNFLKEMEMMEEED